uniref:PHD finger protein 19 n=1 Tax=Poecilia formosa TaxID=48698 RepID=A0A096LXP7_POEFO
MKKRKCIFCLRTRVPPSPPSKLFPERAQSDAGRGSKKPAASVLAERKKKKSKWLLEDAIPTSELSCSWTSKMATIFDFSLDELQSLQSSRSVSVDRDSGTGSGSSRCRSRVGSRKRKLPSNSYSQWANRSEVWEEPSDDPAHLTSEPSCFLSDSAHITSNSSILHSSISSYFGAVGRLTNGERYQVLARRVTCQGTVQYLLEWEGSTPY